MQKIQNLFRKTLIDKYIELSSKENDLKTFMANQADEIAQELKKGDQAEKRVSYEKLYIVNFGFLEFQ